MSETALAATSRHADELIKGIVNPGASLPKGVEEALFGSSMHELGGMEPAQIRAKEFQYRLIEHLLRRLEQKITRGERDLLSPQIRFAREVIGDQLMGILAQVLQAHEQRIKDEQGKRRTIPEKVGISFGLIPDPIANAKEAHKEIDNMFGVLQARVVALEDAIKTSFLLESQDELPPDIKQAMNIRSLCFLALEEVDRLLSLDNISLSKQARSSFDLLVNAKEFTSQEGTTDRSSLVRSIHSLASSIKHCPGVPGPEKGAGQRALLRTLETQLSMYRDQVQVKIDAFILPKIQNYYTKFREE